MTAFARRAVLIVAAAVVLALAAGAWAVHRALDPDRLRPLAERQLSSLLRMPVRIGTLSLRFFPEPSLEGHEIDVGGAAHDAPPSLSVGSLRLTPRLSTVLSPVVVIDAVQLGGVRVNVLRDAEGRWALPGPSHFTAGGARPPAGPSDAPPQNPAAQRAPGSPAWSPASAQGTSIAVEALTLVDGTIAVFDEGHSTPAVTVDRIEAVLHGDPRRVVIERMSGALGRSQLAGSGTLGQAGTELSLTWQDLRPEDMPRLFALAGVSAPRGVTIEGDRPLTLDVSSGKDGLRVRGRLAASRVLLPPLTLTGLSSPLAYDGRSLTLAPLAFAAYKGAYTGRVGLSLAATPLTWRVDGNLAHLDVGALLGATTSLADKVSGTGRVALDLTGVAGQPMARTARGTVTAAVGKGIIRNFPLLASINRALGITGGRGNDTSFDRLDGTFTLGGGRATTRDLGLTAGTLTVSLAGAIGLDAQTLDLSGAARFTREKSLELSRISKHVSGAKNEQGEVELPLTIGGTFAAPDVRIELDKILANAAKKEIQRGITRELNKLFKKP